MNIAIQINKQILSALPEEPLVAASVGVVTCTAEFDDTWEGFARTLVFQREEVSRAVLWTGEPLAVPWEVLAQPGPLFISALGVREGLRLPTAVMEEPLSILPNGCLEGAEPGEVTPTLWDQAMEAVEQLRDEAVRASEAALRAAEVAEALANGSGSAGGTVGGGNWYSLVNRPIDYTVGTILWDGIIAAITPWTGTCPVLSVSAPLVDGRLYLVNWNGESHLCVCSGVVGNRSLVDPAEPDTGEPFALLIGEGGMHVYGYTGEQVNLRVAEGTITKRMPAEFIKGHAAAVLPGDGTSPVTGVSFDGVALDHSITVEPFTE